MVIVEVVYLSIPKPDGTSTPVFRANNDDGDTFGHVLKLASDGRIG